MNSLPLHLLDKILFRLEPKSLAMMQSTNRFINSHLSDPIFESEYFSRFGSSLYNLHCGGARYVLCQPLVSSCKSMSRGKRAIAGGFRCYMLGSCSGLLLLYIGGLFVANPLTKRFRFLDHSGSKFIPTLSGDCWIYLAHPERAMCVGFAVDRKRFKIVCILEMQTRYEFEINDGDSWRLSKTTITTDSKSDLTVWMKPVYLEGTLHWLRNDGSIIAFNTETEQARFIPSSFHREVPDMKLLLAADDKVNRLTLISETKETISFYTLLGNPKWALSRRIKNVSMEENELECWNMVAYDGKRLVVREKKKNRLNGVVHVYDMEANSWGVLGSITWAAGALWDFYKFTPSLCPVEEGEQNHKAIVACSDHRVYYLISIMELINTTYYKSRSNYIYCHPLVSSCDSMSHEKRTYISSSRRCYIFGSCSGLILLYMDGLFIANPLTKRFRILDHSGSKLIPLIVGNFERPHFHKIMCIGFAVDRNRTTKKFKIVCILEMQTRYEFEISDGDSWRFYQKRLSPLAQKVIS
ncbi:unnamed protein product [Arabidopsis halleri]